MKQAGIQEPGELLVEFRDVTLQQPVCGLGFRVGVEGFGSRI